MYLKNYYKSGEWNVICDCCGFKFKSGQLQKRWDGFMVCKDDWETRHPLDFIKAPNPQQALPWTRPQPDDVFVDVPYIDDDVGVQR